MSIKTIINGCGGQRCNLLSVLREVQKEDGMLSESAISEIAEEFNCSTADVKGTATFYHFFSRKPVGKYRVYLNNSITAQMAGFKDVKAAFERETETKFGETSKDGQIGLFETSCIGMCDQEPAALINGVVFTRLTPQKVKNLVSLMRKGLDIVVISRKFAGDGPMVVSNIMQKGDVIFSPFESGAAVKNAIGLKLQAVIDEIKKSNLRGRGGAGFPTGKKWEFCLATPAKKRYVICNADEGEPGTFKDRVLLTEIPWMVFEGMSIAGYVTQAMQGILYVRAEYLYLKNHLENVLNEMRKKKLLGKDILGKRGFNFDIKLVFGAGAYICGEESALIESAEGKRGEPRTRPPFPVTYGYMGAPTIVNNVETFCCVTRIIEKGAGWFRAYGTQMSSGTKLLSISGDCEKSGVYEVPWGLTVDAMLKMVGAKDVQAVWVGGPSGQCVSPENFSRKICYSDLSTGGSIVIIGKNRNILDVVHNFMNFFVEESCGFCVPCRAGNVLLKKKLEKIMGGMGVASDIGDLEQLGKMIKLMSRCGLGQTSPNPIMMTLKNFRSLYENKLVKDRDFVSQFDLAAAVKESCECACRKG